MKKSFYHFIQKYRGAPMKNEWSLFAEEVFHDPAFPKQADQYHELSSYIEANHFPVGTARIFDKMWEIYSTEEN